MKISFVFLSLIFCLNLYADKRIEQNEGVTKFTEKLTKTGSSKMLERWEVAPSKKKKEKSAEDENKIPLKGYIREHDKYSK